MGVKNGIESNRLKKFMQVGVVIQCMCTNFDGRSLSSFGDIAINFFSNFAKFLFQTIDYNSPWVSNNRIK